MTKEEEETNRLNEIDTRTADIINSIKHDFQSLGFYVPEPYRPKFMEILIKNIVANLLKS